MESYIQTLKAASTECVDACDTLKRIIPALPLSSGFAQNVHTIFYVVCNVETVLHHFIDRELLQVRNGDPRSREHGARLQDAIERATSSSTVKPTVKASLLAGGIASLLHLFAHTLHRLNQQLENVLEAERRGDAYAELSAAVALAFILRRASPQWRRMRLAAMGTCAVCSVRALQLRLERRRKIAELDSSQERLTLLLHLWGLATSVLQRAHKANSTSYLDLHSMDRRGSLSRPSSPGGLSASERANGSMGRVTSIEGLASASGASGLNGGLSGGLGLTSARSYVQLVACPGPQDMDAEHKQASRALMDTCVPWTGGKVPHAFWWDSDPVLLTTQRAINAAIAAMVVSLRAVKTARQLFGGGEYALAVFLLPWYLAFPRLAANEVYAIWMSPSIHDLQTIYAPLRWSASVALARRLFGSDLAYEEHRIQGVRIVVIARERLAPERPPSHAGSRLVSSAASDARPLYERPTVLFVPGGAFVADFEVPTVMEPDEPE